VECEKEIDVCAVLTCHNDGQCSTTTQPGQASCLCTPGFTGTSRPLWRFRDSVTIINKKGSPYSITERRVPELIPVLGSRPAGVVSHKPGARLLLLSTRPAVTPDILKRTAINFAAWVNRGTIGVNSLPKTTTTSRLRFEPGPYCA